MGHRHLWGAVILPTIGTQPSIFFGGGERCSDFVEKVAFKLTAGGDGGKKASVVSRGEVWRWTGGMCTGGSISQ